MCFESALLVRMGLTARSTCHRSYGADNTWRAGHTKPRREHTHKHTADTVTCTTGLPQHSKKTYCHTCPQGCQYLTANASTMGAMSNWANGAPYRTAPPWRLQHPPTTQPTHMPTLAGPHARQETINTRVPTHTTNCLGVPAVLWKCWLRCPWKPSSWAQQAQRRTAVHLPLRWPSSSVVPSRGATSVRCRSHG